MTNKFDNLTDIELLIKFMEGYNLVNKTSPMLLAKKETIEKYEGMKLSDISEDDPNYMLMKLFVTFTEELNLLKEIQYEMFRRGNYKPNKEQMS